MVLETGYSRLVYMIIDSAIVGPILARYLFLKYPGEMHSNGNGKLPCISRINLVKVFKKGLLL